MKRTFFIILISIFVILSVAFYFLHRFDAGYDLKTLMAGNLLLAVLSAVSFTLVVRKLDGRPAVFVRGVYAASFLKLIICMAAMLAFVMANKTHLHKPTVFVLFGVYAFYSVAETTSLSKLVRAGKKI